MNLTKAKDKALELLNQKGISEPYVNPIAISKDMGADVKFVTFNESHSNISGFYDCEKDTIYVNESESPLRQTFTIAHELGHRVLHKDWANSNAYRALFRDSQVPKDAFEKEADEFAGNLLVPRFLLDRFYDALDTSDLSKLFAVSVPVIQYRLRTEYGI